MTASTVVTGFSLKQDTGRQQKRNNDETIETHQSILTHVGEEEEDS